LSVMSFGKRIGISSVAKHMSESETGPKKLREEMLSAIRENEISAAQLLDSTVVALQNIRSDCADLELKSAVAQIDRINSNHSEGGVPYPMLEELVNRIDDELGASRFLKIDYADQEKYDNPTKAWIRVLYRFEGAAFDIEEAGKCMALNRYTASVFHLMRIVETAVLSLQCFLEKSDQKAHFGSVLAKLEKLHTKTKFEDIPDRLKPHRQFLIDILPHLHAVKDSWRNKVSHVDEKIVPVDLFTGEMAGDVYRATLALMNKISDGLPK